MELQTTPACTDTLRCGAITTLIDAVAQEQAALANILESERLKIEKAVSLSGVDLDDLTAIDQSAERVIAAVTRLELALQLKLDLFQDCLCPRNGCRGDTPCQES